VDIVERHIPHANITMDLFHMWDLVAIRSDSPVTLGIQITSRGNVNARLKKIKGNPLLKVWCQGDREAWVHGWSEKGKARQPKVWTLHHVRVTP
jgi:hypothetical protein